MKSVVAIVACLACACGPAGRGSRPLQIVSERPLFDAIERHDAAEVEHLLRLGADPNGSTMSPLARAAGNGELDIVDLLLKAGADPNDARHRWTDPEDTALFNAIRGGFTPIVEMLIQAGADPDMRVDIGGASSTALDYAISRTQRDAVSALLAAGADVNARSVWLKAGATPEDMQTLLSRRDAGRTPLMAAVAAGDAALVQLLVRAGADAAAIGENGETALQQAERRDPPVPEIVRILKRPVPTR